MQQAIPLSRLQKGREKNGITVRVIRKWSFRDTTAQANVLYVGLVFADAQGGAIYAQIPQQIVATKEYLFEVGTVCIVKKFRVTNARPHYKPFPGNLMIEITEFTTVEYVQNAPVSIPRYIYRLTPFSALTPAAGAVSAYTDVIGYITKYAALSSFVPKNKEKVTNCREIYIKDLRDEEIKITLWGEQATSFNIDGVYNETNGNLVVCLVLGCIPRRMYDDYNKCYLSGSAACCYYFNPDITEAAAYHSRFKDTPIYIQRPVASEDVMDTLAKDTPLQQKTIAELNSIDPFDFENGVYKCAVTISSIPDNISWWYMSCKPCKKKAEQQADHRYRCPKCLGHNVMPRYSLSFMAHDDTGDARFFAFDELARHIVQKECEAIMNPLALASGLPLPLQRIIGRLYIFGIDLNDESCSSNLRRQYIVKSVLERGPNQNDPAQVEASDPVKQIAHAETFQQKEVSATLVNTKEVNQDISVIGQTTLQTDTSVDVAAADHQAPTTLLLTAPQGGQQTPPPPSTATETPCKDTLPRSMVRASNISRNLFGDRSKQAQVTPQQDTVLAEEVEQSADEPISEPKNKRKRKAEPVSSSRS